MFDENEVQYLRKELEKRDKDFNELIVIRNRLKNENNEIKENSKKDNLKNKNELKKLNRENEILKIEFSQLKFDHEILKKECDKKIDIAEINASKRVEQLKKLSKSMFDALGEEKLHLKNELAQASLILKNHTIQISKLENQLQTNIQQLEETTDKLDESLTKTSEKNQELKKLLNENQDLEKKNSLLQRSEIKFKEIYEAHVELKEILEQQNNTITNLTQNLTNTEEKNKQLQQNYNEFESSVKAVQIQCECGTCGIIHKEKQKFCDECGASMDENPVEKAAEQLKQKYTKLKEQYTELKENLQKMIGENINIKNNLHIFEQTNKEQGQLINESAKSIETLQKEKKILETAKEDAFTYKKQFEDISSSFENLKLMIKLKQNAYENSILESEDLKSKNEELQCSVETLKDKNEFFNLYEKHVSIHYQFLDLEATTEEEETKNTQKQKVEGMSTIYDIDIFKNDAEDMANLNTNAILESISQQPETLLASENTNATTVEQTESQPETLLISDKTNATMVEEPESQPKTPLGRGGAGGSVCCPEITLVGECLS